jgi:hypothetical protein
MESMMRALVLLVIFAGCGGGGVSAEQAQADCETLISDYFCAKSVECEPTLALADCVAEVHTSVNCAVVIGENDQLPQCETELRATTCAVFDPHDGSGLHPPAACQGVFHTR